MISNTVEMARLVVVSRDSAVLRSLCSLGESNCWQLEVAADAWEVMDKVQSGAMLDMVLLDLPPEDEGGLHILRWLRRLRPALSIVLIGHPDDNGRKQESIRMGVRDYLVRPLDDRQLEMAIQRNLNAEDADGDPEITSDDVEPLSDDSFFIGISPAMRKLRAQAALIAEANVPVLILGESGSGRQTAARLIHSLSAGSGFQFAKVNCAALPADLLERELFGYEKNGTAAPPRTRFGKLELCAKGTLLLDEITEIPRGVQSNLMQVLQNKQFIRPGTSAFVDVDVRILAMCHTNVERAISENRLREDLYRHLSSYTIYVPPLRDRKEELPFLSRHFMHRLAKHYGLMPREFPPGMIEAWKKYNWPGNLRELENQVKRYLMVGDKEIVFENRQTNSMSETRGAGVAKSRGLAQVPPPSSQSHAGITSSKSLRSLIQSVKSEAERNAIAAALERTGWNRKAAARLLNVSYRTVLYKIDQYRLTASDSPMFPAAQGLIGEGTGFRDDEHRQSTNSGSKPLMPRRLGSI